MADELEGRGGRERKSYGGQQRQWQWKLQVSSPAAAFPLSALMQQSLSNARMGVSLTCVRVKCVREVMCARVRSYECVLHAGAAGASKRAEFEIACHLPLTRTQHALRPSNHHPPMRQTMTNLNRDAAIRITRPIARKSCLNQPLAASGLSSFKPPSRSR